MRSEEQRQDKAARLSQFREGRDELNLAELPLAGISDRFLSGDKTVVFVDRVWDEGKKALVERKLAISGSDMYGLPTAKDDDVLLACVQLSSIGDFHNREVHFSRYELLKLLRWEDQTRNYRRLSESLRRWKGLTIYSDRAFYDHARKSWVTRDFGIFDNLYIYEREERDGARAAARSCFIWNEVLFESFGSGYLKRLDWDLYLSLKDPVAKRLYRLLDKRFYRTNTLSFDLQELALNKVRMSEGYNTAQMKRALMKGIRELEAVWDLAEMSPENRFRKVGSGRWEAVFVRREKKAAKRLADKREPSGLARELSSRGVSVDVAQELTQEQSEERIRGMVELFDWHNSRGQARGAGFLVAGIRSEEPFVAPKGFSPKRERLIRSTGGNSRNSRERKLREGVKPKRSEKDVAQERAFFAFWEGLTSSEQKAFEERSLAAADRTKRDGYLRLREIGGVVFEQYRRIILQDFFQRAGQAEFGKSALP
jgi:hypothetical protein